MAVAVLTSGGISYIRDWLIGLNVNPPSYIAMSSGTLPAPPAPGSFWTQLPAETSRVGIVSADADGQAAIFHAFLGLADNINQVTCYYGLIGGNPSLSPNTGTLIAIAAEPTPYSKNSLNTVTIDLTVTISGSVS